MTTPLARPLRRAVMIDGAPYTATIRAEGIRLVPKGRRSGVEVTWQQILAGDVVLHAQLAASVDAHATDAPRPTVARAPRRAASR